MTVRSTPNIFNARRILLCRALAVLFAVSTCSSHARGDHIDLIQDDSNPGNGITDATFTLNALPTFTVMAMHTGEVADILGGERIVTLSNLSAGPGTVTAKRELGSTFIEFDNLGDQSESLALGKLTLDYKAFENEDFASNYGFIVVDFLAVEGAGASGDLTISVESSAGNGTSSVQAVTAAGQYFFGFNDPGFAGVDFFDVDRVTMMLTTTVHESDFRIGSITLAEVPEPATLVLFATGGLAVLLVTLRRARAR